MQGVVQPPPRSGSFPDRCLPCPTPQVALGTQACELLEVMDKVLCLLKLQFPSRSK